MMSSKSLAHKGFNLIELMVVVAVIGVLTTIALPSYNEYIAKSRRAEARTQLLSAQQWVERIYSESYTYATNTSGDSISGLLALQPFKQSPREGAASYTLGIVADASSYTLTATRTGPAAADKCGDLTLTGTGLKSVVSYNTSKYSTLSAAVNACWR